MNSNHLQQIFTNYIERFEELNNPVHREYYKWQIAKKFRPLMDDALASSAEEFPAKLSAVKRLTENVIDSYTQPFYGLAVLAEKEPETVKELFLNLYADGRNDPDERQRRVSEFLRRSHELRDKYYPDSYLYKNDMHSVTGYLFLYDPDNNYMFKASSALAFADCIEFYDDWGSGDNTKLDVYYRMCDQLVDAIKSSKELMATDASRFEGKWGTDPETMHADTNKHILAFDLIYCCKAYGLFTGISFSRPKTKEWQLLQMKKDKALQLSQELEKAKNSKTALEEAEKYINGIFCSGASLTHRKFGRGIVTKNNGSTITVDFEDAGEKQLDQFASAAGGFIASESAGYDEKIGLYKDILKSRQSVNAILNYAEKAFAEYAEYTD